MPGWLFLLLALLEKYRMGGDLHSTMPMYKKCIRCLLFMSPRRVRYALLFHPTHVLSWLCFFLFVPLDLMCVYVCVRPGYQSVDGNRWRALRSFLASPLFHVVSKSHQKSRLTFPQAGELAACASSTNNVSSSISSIVPGPTSVHLKICLRNIGHPLLLISSHTRCPKRHTCSTSSY